MKNVAWIRLSVRRFFLALSVVLAGCSPAGQELAGFFEGDQPTAKSILEIDAPNVYSRSELVVETFPEPGTGKLIEKVVVPGRPPVVYRAETASVPVANPAAGVNILPNAPAFDWTYGCSPTAAGMMMGYYDLHGYVNMYTGPTNGGASPLDNGVWGHGECPLIASHQGIDGRGGRGHVDDYWITGGDPGPDPYITGGWAEHWPPDCTADFMGSNQSKFGSSDGSTTFWYFTDGSPMYDFTGGEPGARDGCHGLRLYAESKGYIVSSNFSQDIMGYNGNTQGFTFEDYQAEIDAGRPVLIQVSGHTMLGFGYDTAGNTVYLHDTWDYGNHTMTWGGSYSGMAHYGVTVLQLVPADAVVLLSESFESAFVNGAPPNWTRAYKTNTLDWVRASGDLSGGSAHGGTYNALLGSDDTNSHETYLITPPIAITDNLTDPTLEFWHRQVHWENCQDTLTICYKTSAGGAWIPLAQYTSDVSWWTRETLALPDPTATYYIGFLGNARYGWGVCLDDVRVMARPRIPGDANGDHRVSFEDFSILQNNYNHSGKTFGQGDFNGDGMVSFEDFAILQNHYGQTGF